MADIKGIVTADGEGYFVTDGESESDAADWGVPVDFNDARYLGETDGDVATLSRVTVIPAAEWEDEEDEDDEGEEIASAT